MGIFDIMSTRGAVIDKASGIKRRGSKELVKEKIASFNDDGSFTGAGLSKDGLFFVPKPGFKLSKRMIEENSAMKDSIAAGN